MISRYTVVRTWDHIILVLLLSPQNQFFISSLPTEELRNEIPDAIRDRIIEAYRSGQKFQKSDQKFQKNEQKFRVIIVLPQLPEFAGISTLAARCPVSRQCLEEWRWGHSNLTTCTCSTNSHPMSPCDVIMVHKPMGIHVGSLLLDDIL